jgi:hypothetical protein
MTAHNFTYIAQIFFMFGTTYECELATHIFIQWLQ